MTLDCFIMLPQYQGFILVKQRGTLAHFWKQLWSFVFFFAVKKSHNIVGGNNAILEAMYFVSKLLVCTQDIRD